jgi:hypothetical protein
MPGRKEKDMFTDISAMIQAGHVVQFYRDSSTKIWHMHVGSHRYAAFTFEGVIQAAKTGENF